MRIISKEPTKNMDKESLQKTIAKYDGKIDYLCEEMFDSKIKHWLDLLLVTLPSGNIIEVQYHGIDTVTKKFKKIYVPMYEISLNNKGFMFRFAEMYVKKYSSLLSAIKCMCDFDKCIK